MGMIEKRRSIRKFSKRTISKEKIYQILKAGIQAPSPKNRQPWEFVIIIDKQKKDMLVSSMKREINALYQKKNDRKDIKESLLTMKSIEEAPVLILVCYQFGMVEVHDDGVNWCISSSDIEALELQSIGAAVENMLLKAEEIGIGSLWCGDVLYAYKTISAYSEKPVVSAVCLGYAEEHPPARDRKSIKDKCIFI